MAEPSLHEQLDAQAERVAESLRQHPDLAIRVLALLRGDWVILDRWRLEGPNIEHLHGEEILTEKTGDDRGWVREDNAGVRWAEVRRELGVWVWRVFGDDPRYQELHVPSHRVRWNGIAPTCREAMEMADTKLSQLWPLPVVLPPDTDWDIDNEGMCRPDRMKANGWIIITDKWVWKREVSAWVINGGAQFIHGVTGSPVAQTQPHQDGFLWVVFDEFQEPQGDQSHIMADGMGECDTEEEANRAAEVFLMELGYMLQGGLSPT